MLSIGNQYKIPLRKLYHKHRVNCKFLVLNVPYDYKIVNLNGNMT